LVRPRGFQLRFGCLTNRGVPSRGQRGLAWAVASRNYIYVEPVIKHVQRLGRVAVALAKHLPVKSVVFVRS